MNEVTYLSTNIRHLRKITGITQNELAKICGKTANAIGNYEMGIREPSAIDLWNIANYFGISVDDLVTKDLRFKKFEQISANQFVNEVNDLLDKSDINDKQKNVIKAILENIKED